MMADKRIESPVLTIDGPGGAGKGTAAIKISQRLGWHFLDSGALYRILGHVSQQKGVSFEDISGLCELASDMDVRFEPNITTFESVVLFGEQDITVRIRSEEAGNNASKVAVNPRVRDALLEKQRSFLKAPGLVADGRDMGTVVFTDAPLKIYLTASAEERAKRRYNQLKQKGFDVSLAHLLQDIQSRDERDMGRKVAPLTPAEDAVIIDSTELDITEVVAQVMDLLKTRKLL